MGIPQVDLKGGQVMTRSCAAHFPGNILASSGHDKATCRSGEVRRDSRNIDCGTF